MREERREREKDNDVEVNDLTVHFEGDGRSEEEGGVMRKVARRGSKKRPPKQKVRRKSDPITQKKVRPVARAAGVLR